METIEIAQAVLEINELLEIVAKGQEIIITKNHEPMVSRNAPYKISDHNQFSIVSDIK